jgi:hypothetical protein
MYRLRRFYLDSIGVSENRFHDLLVDLTAIDGDPADAIVWLRNGAGKTTMLSLLIALVLPNRSEFLATRTRKRTLEDLILGGDTAHVVAEWVDPAGHVMLTGAVHEWEGRVRPRDYNDAGAARLRSGWWIVHPDPSVTGSTLDDLPYTARSGGRVDADRFLNHVRDLVHQGVNAVVARRPPEWRAALAERRFDPELFRYFAEVNATEGGIEGLFAEVASAGAFVRWLLRFVSDRERVAQVAKLLADTATEIAKRPTYLAERDFCDQAGPHLRRLATAHAAAAAAREQHRRVVGRAASVKRAVYEAEIETRAAEETLNSHIAHVDAALTPLRTSVRDARRQAEAYRSSAAEFRVAAADRALEAAQQAARQARLVANAWAAVPDHAEFSRARHDLHIREATLAAAETEAQPLVSALAHARSELAAALDTTLALGRARQEAHTAELGNADDGVHEAETLQEQHRGRIRELETELALCEHVLDDFESQIRALADQELIASGEDLETALRRWENLGAEAQRAVDDDAGVRGSAEAALRQAGAARENAHSAASTADKQHDRARDELTRFQDRARDIGERQRVRELIQSDTVDVASIVADLGGLLTTAITAADSSIVDLRSDVAGDLRAAQALATDGLLPPRPAAAKVLEALAAEGRSAHSGWRYLQENIPPHEHRRFVAELPEILDGIIVYGDPGEAAESVRESLEGEVEDAVVVSSARAFRERRDPRAVLGPSSARYDRAAAATELARRETRVTAAESQIGDWRRQRDIDARLRADVESFVAALPADGMSGLTAREHAAARAGRDAAEAEESAQLKLTSCRARIADLDSALASAREAVARCSGVLPQLRQLLARQAEHVDPSRLRREQLPGEIEPVRRHLAAAIDAQRDAESRRSDARLALRLLEEQIKQWETERAELPHPVATEMTVDTARSAVAEADRLLREQYREDELRRQVADARGQLRPLAKRWHDHDEQVRARAEQFATSADGVDGVLRTEATARASKGLETAQQQVGSADGELRAARSARASAPTIRLREDDPAPTDEDDATRLAAAADTEAATRQLEVGKRERELETTRSEHTRAVTRAAMLRDQLTNLRTVPTADHSADQLPADDDALRELIRNLVEELDATLGMAEAAEDELTDSAEAIRRWAAQDRFRAVAEDENGQAVKRLRELFQGDAVRSRVAPAADELADDLGLRRDAIAIQLVQVEEHKQNVVARLADHVEDALKLLRRASTLSELPEGIGPWAGRPFLTVEANGRPTRDQMTVRVADLVDRMVNAGKIERRPHELLWQATDAAIVEGFRATVLKPAPDQPTARTPVENMRKWSGGENLTASLVVFCVLARLRAEQRTGTAGQAAGGVLPLDNPLGKANYLPFLELQRRVARASGVQLVFWTGIGDLGAVTAFPRIAALHKRPAITRPGRAYVQVDEAGSQVLDVTGAVRAEP